MTAPHVTVVDYGIGNLYSVQRACESCGATVELTSDCDAIANAARLILPGVGAFADGMAGLRERQLVGPLREFAASGRPLLGICLGMQLLADASEEFGVHEGLGLIHGRVVQIPPATIDGSAQHIPRVGWTSLDPVAESVWADTPLRNTPAGACVYLVHSYHFVCDVPSEVLAVSEYGGHQLASAIRAHNVVGFQFHPERSGPEGLRILEAFVNDETT
jgi:imidazole glycerol-phosphate synthase subunit HisH